MGRPHGEANSRFGLAINIEFVRAEPAAVRQVIAFGLIGAVQREAAVAFDRRRVMHLGEDTPRVGVLWCIDIHPPSEGLTDLAVVEVDGRPEGGATVFGGKLGHWQRGPLVGPATLAAPASRQAGTDEESSPEPREILEIHRY
jgi:hypothetical protein